ncbi:MAG: SPFH domain-containing protein [Bacteroidales bacterium]|nr:SPFH domain-containing protein [Bacteroidales bacterium]MDD4492664.1 SPFH domain-containing protein [Bacteroidales bacterium]HNW48603.1 SPFH domain-containing protein [Bacteroidales bacterium]
MDTNEFSFKGFKANGFLMLFANFVLILACVALLIFFSQLSVWIIVIAVIGLVKSFFIWAGFFELEPNEARLMVFFGKYKGTFRETGFYWVNPFITKKKLSMRSRNLDVKPIKVNDKAGNPIMIGLVLIWKLSDTYKAMFDIDSQTMASTNPASGTSAVGIQTVSSRMNAFENFVKVQSDAALRQVAGQYAYDDNESEGDSITLRGGGEEINHRLVAELNNRLSMAGIEISEARLNYLAYAPEIAAVMLRRQQATAVIAAREKIVEGAVSMVKMALDKIEKEDIVKFDKTDKARMVANLLVVLCADEAAQPVINAGN